MISAVDDGFDALLMVAFDDGGKLQSHLAHALTGSLRVETLDALRLPDNRITVKHAYLDPKNFATNYALLRDGAGLHTRVWSPPTTGLSAIGHRSSGAD